jgi:hypothetical protein
MMLRGSRSRVVRRFGGAAVRRFSSGCEVRVRGSGSGFGFGFAPRTSRLAGFRLLPRAYFQLLELCRNRAGISGFFGAAAASGSPEAAAISRSSSSSLGSPDI